VVAASGGSKDIDEVDLVVVARFQRRSELRGFYCGIVKQSFLLLVLTRVARTISPYAVPATIR
jgi:hypothetical protein